MNRESERNDNPFSSPPVRIMDKEAILNTIPHRYPFLFVDRVEVIEEGKRCVGIKCVMADEPFFQGHFPGRPIMPGVLIIEAMAQTSAAMIMGSPSKAGKLAFFIGIDSAKFRRQVLPGQCLRLAVEILHSSSRGGKVKGQAYVDNKLCAEGLLTFAFVDKNHVG